MSKSSLPMPAPSAVIRILISSKKHLVETRLLDVQDLALEREDRLVLAVAALLGRAAGAVPFDEIDLAERRVFLLAVGHLAGQAAPVERGLAAGEIAGLAGGDAGQRPSRSPFWMIFLAIDGFCSK